MYFLSLFLFLFPSDPDLSFGGFDISLWSCLLHYFKGKIIISSVSIIHVSEYRNKTWNSLGRRLVRRQFGVQELQLRRKHFLFCLHCPLSARRDAPSRAGRVFLGIPQRGGHGATVPAGLCPLLPPALPAQRGIREICPGLQEQHTATWCSLFKGAAESWGCRRWLSDLKITYISLFKWQQREGMPVKIRIGSERCPETGRDIVCPSKLAVFSFYCSVTSMSLVCAAFSASWESAKGWGEISPSLSFPELAAFLCLFSAFSSSATRTLRKKNVLQEKFRNVQMLGGRIMYFLTISKHRIPLKTSNRNCSKKFYFNEHFCT